MTKQSPKLPIATIVRSVTIVLTTGLLSCATQPKIESETPPDSPEIGNPEADNLPGLSMMYCKTSAKETVAACTGTSGKTLCVDKSSTASEKGTADSPFHTIAAAVRVATSGSTILVAKGEYKENIEFADKTLTLRGGFLAQDNFQNPNIQENITKVIGQGNAPVFALINAGPSVVRGFHISGGTGKVKYRAEGGGVYTRGGKPTISCNTIENNDVRAGHVDDYGGGIAMLSDGFILGNIIQNNYAARGAGLFAAGSTVIAQNVVRNNIGVGDHGGGIYAAGPNIEVSNNLVIDNEIGRKINYGWGGGIMIQEQGTYAKLRGNTITGNFAPSKGSGVFVDNGAKADMEHEIIFANLCGVDGGSGIYVNGLDQSGNTGSVLKIRNSTIVNNNCKTRDGGNGIYVSGAGSRVEVSNSIFWGNQDDFYDAQNAVLTVEFSLSEEKKEGQGNIHSNPLFADTGIGGFHLQSTEGHWNRATDSWKKDTTSSPAIDTGSPASSFTSETSPHGNRSNLGAYGNTQEASRSK